MKRKSIQQPHQVERDVSFRDSQNTAGYCTQLELEDYLKQFPHSALALFYEYDPNDYLEPDSNFEKFAVKVTSLLTSGKILFPHQTLEALSNYLQEEVFDKLTPNPDIDAE